MLTFVGGSVDQGFQIAGALLADLFPYLAVLVGALAVGLVVAVIVGRLR